MAPDPRLFELKNEHVRVHQKPTDGSDVYILKENSNLFVMEPNIKKIIGRYQSDKTLEEIEKQVSSPYEVKLSEAYAPCGFSPPNVISQENNLTSIIDQSKLLTITIHESSRSWESIHTKGFFNGKFHIEFKSNCLVECRMIQSPYLIVFHNKLDVKIISDIIEGLSIDNSCSLSKFFSRKKYLEMYGRQFQIMNNESLKSFTSPIDLSTYFKLPHDDIFWKVCCNIKTLIDELTMIENILDLVLSDNSLVRKILATIISC